MTTSPDFARASSRSTGADRPLLGTLTATGSQTHGTFIPQRVGIGFGIWTIVPIRDGRSRSLDGQGIIARWRRFRLRDVDA
jgi:hypothetical protein